MNNDKVDWQGNFPAVVTPFKADGEIDREKFAANIELLMSEGIDGFVIAGSNGESWALTSEERLELFKLGAEVSGGKIPVIGGTGSIRTVDVAGLSAASRDAGIDGVMIMPPYYCKPSRREVIEHYRTVSDEARIPILIYNSPGSTGTNVDAKLCDELADLEWVVAIKQSTTDFVEFQETVALCGEKVRVFTGHSATRGMSCVLVGGVGFVSSLDSQVMGAEGISLFRLSKEGKLDEARTIQARTLLLARTLAPVSSGPAIMKATMNMVGRPAGYPRKPLLTPTRDELAIAEKVLDELDLSRTAQAAQ